MIDSMNYVKNWISNGDAVAHIDNLELKMRVSHFVFESKEIENTRIKRFRGVKCTWWASAESGERRLLIDAEFHSRELVPWDVAEKGRENVNKFLNRAFKNVD